jgi:hypothetical protein
VQTQQIYVARGREAVSEIRLRLFVFPEVLDVLATSKSDSLVVVVDGRPRPAEWSSHLRAAGYEILPRPGPSAARRASALMGERGPAPLGPAGEVRAEGGRRRCPRRGRRGARARVTAPPGGSATQSRPNLASGGG